MKKKTRKITWKSALCFLLISAFSLAALAGIGALFRSDDTKTISPTVFSVGALNEQGCYVESDLSIITKDLIACQGLVIEPDFTNISDTFEVFYYSDRKVFIGSSGVLNAADGIYIKNGDFGTAAYCRIMITPEVPVDYDGKEVKGYKIRFWEVYDIANNYTITVFRDQKSLNAVDLFEVDQDLLGKYFYVSNDKVLTEVKDGSACVEIDVTDCFILSLLYRGESYLISYWFTDENNTVLSTGKISTSNVRLEVPETATSLKFNYTVGKEPKVICYK